MENKNWETAFNGFIQDKVYFNACNLINQIKMNLDKYHLIWSTKHKIAHLNI